MSSPSNLLPVFLCGRRFEIGKPIAEILAPEFEVPQWSGPLERFQLLITPTCNIHTFITHTHRLPVIHFCMDAETAITEIPRLAGKVKEKLMKWQKGGCGEWDCSVVISAIGPVGRHGQSIYTVEY